MVVLPNALIDMLTDNFGHRITIIDGDDENSLPDWAASLIWLGAWCRSFLQDGKRLIVFAVLPTRALAAAFASFGCLVSGAAEFEDALSWPTFKKLPTGQSVFWVHRNTSSRYCGEIVGFKEFEGAEFIIVKVTKAPRKAELGMIREISRSYFDEYRFTEEKPLSMSKAALFETTQLSLSSLITNLNPKWMWADGAEGLIVSNVDKFESSIEGLSLSIDGKSPIPMSNMLCLGRNKDHRHAKLRIDHPRGTLNGDFPLAILDGPNAFMMHEHLSTVPNILVILNRSEYQANIDDKVLELSSISQEIKVEFISAMPGNFAPGIELAAYLIDGQ